MRTRTTPHTILCTGCDQPFHPRAERTTGLRYCSNLCRRRRTVQVCANPACCNFVILRPGQTRSYRKRPKPKNHCCSRKCTYIVLAATRRGALHHRFQHGLTRTPEYKRALQARRHRCAKEGRQFTAEDVLARIKAQRGRCYLCTKALRRRRDGSFIYHIDHWRPLIKSQDNSARNIRITHPRCNLQKHDDDPLTFARKRGLLLL